MKTQGRNRTASAKPHQLLNDRGAVAVMVAVMLVVFLALAALAVDLGHFMVVTNELQNASDSGALAGARVLYASSGTEVNTGANGQALAVATLNKSEKAPVEVGAGDVQRGHWSFATRTFTPNDSTTPPDLDKSTAELDADVNFINAVRVVARREAVPTQSFFGNFVGYGSFASNRDAVGYIGFAGELAPGEVDLPIAICKQAIIIDSKYSCNVGRMINSGTSSTTHNTGGWTNFTQGPCETASASSVKPLVISGTGNPETIYLGDGVGTTGGEIQVALNELYNRWKSMSSLDSNGDGIPDKPWNVTLLVIDCDGNNVGNCSTTKGAVNLNIIWINAKNDPSYSKVPRTMTVDEGPSFTCTDPSGLVCWNNFVSTFNLKTADGAAAEYLDKAIYFLPDCSPHELKGRTGGENFGVLAKIPVLVK